MGQGKPDTSKANKKSPRRRRRWWKWAGAVAGILVVALAGARLALPSYLRSYVNRVLDESPDYVGSIGDVEVHMWRGAYTVLDMNIRKRRHAVAVPFFECPRVDFSLSWNALLHGAARGKIVMDRPKLNFVHGPSTEETQTGTDQPWLQIVDDLYPFRIDKAEVHGGEVHFRTFHTSPQVNIYLSEVEGTLENLTNIRDTTDPMVAKLAATGDAMGGEFSLDMTLDPDSHQPTFELSARLLDVDVTKLNSLTRAYGDFDFEEGRFDYVMEVGVKEGQMEGYAKPLFRGVKVLSLRDIGTKDPLQLFWEALVGIVGEVFKNQPRDQFGTRITLSGEFDNPRTDLPEIVGNVLRNAFVRAYLPRFEGRVALESGGGVESERKKR